MANVDRIHSLNDMFQTLNKKIEQEKYETHLFYLLMKPKQKALSSNIFN